MKQFLALLLLLPMMASAQLSPIYRQFFTTNTAPVVDVVAGSNATVVASTPNASTRRFTVSSTATGGTGQTNWPLSSLTNVPPGDGWALISSNNVPVWSLNGGAITNVPFAIFTNYTAAPANFTNLSGLAFGAGMYGMTSYWDYATVAGVGPIAIWYNGIDTNTVITTNGGAFSGEILDNSPTKLSPSSNQLVTAYWVRSLFNQGAAYYASTNIATGTNASQANQVLYQFQSTIPIPFARSYSTADFLTNTGYIGSVVTTNTFQSLGGAITISAYLGFTGGNPTPTLTLHPEIYYSYDKTNWYGDYSSQNQSITWNTTNLYQWTVDFPYYSSTNAAGFYVQRRFKVGTTTGTGGARSLHFLGGTNSISGPSDASHITMQSPTATAGNAYLAANQTFTGTNTFTQSITSGGLVKGTNGIASGILTVATLPASPVTGQMVWASDVITSRGTGDYCTYDGSNWRTRENIIATASTTNYVLNAWAACVSLMSPSMIVSSSAEMRTTPSQLIAITSGTTGTGASAGFGGNNAYGNFYAPYTGTDTTGSARVYGYKFIQNASTWTNGSGFAVHVSNLCDGTDKYWAFVGCGTAIAGAFPTTGAGFVYDMYTNSVTTPAGASATYTNNWICMNANGSSYTYVDSGLPVVTSASAPQNLRVICQPDVTLFYTNGVLCTAIANNIPSNAAMYHNLAFITKTAGTTTRGMNCYWPSVYSSHPAVDIK